MSDDLRRQICDAFGVSEEIVTAYDEAIGWPAKRERERHFREVVLPSRVAEVHAALVEQYPELFVPPTEELGHEDRLKLDVLLYGHAYERRYSDGRRERIPPDEVVQHLPPDDS